MEAIQRKVCSPYLRATVQPPATAAAAPPRDVVSLSNVAAPSTVSLSRAGKTLALGAALVAVGGLLTGCGTSLTPEQLGPPVAAVTAQQDRDQSMRFEVVPNSLRVDVIRQTHTETTCTTDSNGDEDCTTTTEPDPYQPVGVYLGKGLFLDAGMNLSVVPDRVYHGPLVPQDFQRLVIKGPFGSWSQSVATTQGNTVGISRTLQLFDNQVVRDGPDHTTLKLGTFKSLQNLNNIEITRHGDDIDIQAWAPNVSLLKAMQRVEIRTQGNTVTVHPFGPKGLVNTNVTYNNDGTVTVQPFGGHFTRTDISKGPGEQIHVNHWGLGKYSTERGQTGLNETATAIGVSMKGNVVIQGDHYDINEPHVFGHSTITVQK